MTWIVTAARVASTDEVPRVVRRFLHTLAESAVPRNLLELGTMLVVGALLYLLLRLVVVRVIKMITEKTRTDWDRTFVRRGTFNRLAALAPALVLYAWLGNWTSEGGEWFVNLSTFDAFFQLFLLVWILLFALLVVYAVFNAALDIYNTFPFSRTLPLRSFVQIGKLLAFLLFVIVLISILVDESPALLLSGLGAMTAVLMFVFKDPILGFVAGITLSANKMLMVGDWLEMPKYGADGDVMEITLTTVKVRNFDQTITTVPTYALITDSFKNWRGILEAGGRRICRNLFVDMNTIRFLSVEDIEALRKAKLLSHYIEDKLASIEEDNRALDADPTCPLNGRRLTNIGTFRAYLKSYIDAHPGINHEMISMVRQQQPTEHGLPLQLYMFTSSTAWVTYENIQSDIFDHIFAVVPAFGLRIFQEPTGNDFRQGLTGGNTPPAPGLSTSPPGTCKAPGTNALPPASANPDGTGSRNPDPHG